MSLDNMWKNTVSLDHAHFYQIIIHPQRHLRLEISSQLNNGFVNSPFLYSAFPKGLKVVYILPLRVDTGKQEARIQEPKEWVCLMEYLKSFPDRDGEGRSDIPEKYSGKLGRIMREPSWNPITLLIRREPLMV